MNYRVTHSTEYFYGDDVSSSHSLLHLSPRATDKQQILSTQIAITPAPAWQSDRTDFFGNSICWFSLSEPHRGLKVTGTSEVSCLGFDLPADASWPNWESVIDRLRDHPDADALSAAPFSYASPFVEPHEELASYAKSSFSPNRSLLDAVMELTMRIHDDFTFDTRATTIGTPVLEVLHHRHGVCQDFAHLQIGCLRTLGLAARYVSGYLVTKPPPGRPRLVGSDVSHAWLSVWFPNFGWIDFDPTNGVVPSDQHITVAWARDYDDVSPVRGVVIGGRRHGLSVSVDVAPI